MLKQESGNTFTALEIAVVVLVCLFVVAIAGPAAQKSRLDANRAQCMKNLSTIGKAMQIYTGDYDGQFPHSGGRNSTWSMRIPNWRAPNRFSAFGLAPDGSGGVGSISSCFYLLVKYAEVAPNTFVCPGDVGATEFNPADYGAGDRELIVLWDFGPEPPNHCSYSYHLPFGLYYLTTSSDSRMAVAADRNPWISTRTAEPKDISQFNPEGDRQAVKYGNSISHDEDGQNVLYLDGHVNFEEHSFSGINDDNIYTYWDGGDIRRGGQPQITSLQADKEDSLLVNDPTLHKTTINKQASIVDCADLKSTSIVATLDCPMAEHKNVIWCSTFQMTWDKLKEDIIGEPIKVPKASELAARLNQAEFSQANLEPESFYARVGFVKDGIIDQIRKDMGTRFSSELLPQFHELDAMPPAMSDDAIISYSYLKTAIDFKYPFYTNERAFTFEDSNGERTKVTSFCEHTSAPDPNEKLVHEQVDILYYKYADENNPAEYAVDLSKHTSPYQVVLALVPPQDTLAEIMAVTKHKVSEFRHDQDYEALRKLRNIDSLIVPDVLYQVTHHFRELEGRTFANSNLPAYLILEAMQMVDFTLSRTGVVLKSEAQMIAAPFANRARRLQEPRHLYFDRPFLIYVQKRGEEFSPFFVMWVDNAELMEKF